MVVDQDSAVRSENARRAAPAAWIRVYNHHRPHTALGRSPPTTRLTNLTDQYRLGPRGASASEDLLPVAAATTQDHARPAVVATDPAHGPLTRPEARGPDLVAEEPVPALGILAVGVEDRVCQMDSSSSVSVTGCSSQRP